MMNGEQEISSKDAVTSVGNAWIIGRSKRYHNRLYYFNTLTGKAAWNLSESEMEKAKIRPPQDSVTINCPEPQEPPSDITAHKLSNSVASKIYNKQIINNQITRLPFIPTLTNTSCSTCVNTGNQIPGFNPNVWSIPPMHQIFITPAISNQPQLPINLTSNSYYPNFKQRRFTNRGYGKYKKFGQRRTNLQYNRGTQFQETPDLRVILSAKRKLQDFCNKRNADNTERVDTGYEQVDTNASTYTKPSSESKDNLCPSDVDEEWLEEHIHYQGTKPILDVTALSKLVSKHGGSECWYIVVDASILLNHLDFLNILLNSDSNCLLIVQQATMIELRKGTVSGDFRLKKRSRKALCFLSQQTNSKNAVIDDQHKNEDCVFEPNHQALSCCIVLSEKNEHVVLLTNDEDLIEYKNDVKFPILSVNDMKKFLEVKCDDAQMQFPEHSKAMSITIPNDVAQDIKMSPVDRSYELISNPEETLLSNSMSVTPDSKVTVDAEVQTDYADKTIAVTTTRETSLEETCSNSKESVNSTKSLTKKKEICLKRPVLCQTLNKDRQTNKTGTLEKKFKWHKKIHVPDGGSKLQDAKSVDKISIPTCNMTVASQENINNWGSDIVENSETSSCTLYRPHVDVGVIIEETSTSVISNSIDSESVYSSKPVHATTYCNESDQSVMFEITSSFMEEHLKRNSDEWISRFLQIMEEVLSQVLQQEPTFVHTQMPPPWTAQEAVECTKKKFSNQPDVIDACNKLSQIFFELSDAKGNIFKNVQPQQFMKMYSYGVYLIDSLVSVQDSEDLQTSTESLTKLLNDIQDPNLEAMNISFSENMNDLSLNVQESSMRPVTPTNPITSTVEDFNRTLSSKNSTPTTTSTQKRYKLRSTMIRKIAETEKKEPEVNFVRTYDAQSNFFSSRKLQKSQNDKSHITRTNDNDKSPGDEPKTVEDSKINPIREETSPDKPEPKIIRNFTQCPEFENRLKNKPKPTLDLDELDYYEEFDEKDVEEYEYEEEFETDVREQQLVSENGDSLIPENSNDLSVFSEIRDQETFKWFVAAVWCEIKIIISKVHTFCENTILHLQGSHQSSLSKDIDIRNQAEKSRNDLDNLCTALISVNLSQENSRHSVQEILQYLGIDCNEDITMNAEQLGKYREMVQICMDQAVLLLKSLNLIINAIDT